MYNENSEKYLENIVKGNFGWVKKALVEDVSLVAVLQDCACWLLSESPIGTKQHVIKLHDFACQAVEKWHKKAIDKILDDWDNDRERLLNMCEFF